MRNILTICREYGEDLAWWEDLEVGLQHLYLADYRIRVREHNRRAEVAGRG